MSFRDLNLKRRYKSLGSDGIATGFLIPALKETKLYQRSVGFFSSGVLDPIFNSVLTLSRKGGKIQLIASPQLSEDDITAINNGYEKRSIIENAFSRDFCHEASYYTDDNLLLLTELIANKVLDIKIAITDTAGEYHDKLGILTDFDGNIITFSGSPNSTYNGYKQNYEIARLSMSWVESDIDDIHDEIAEFDSLWNNTNPFLNVFDYRECALKELLKIRESRSSKAKTSDPIKLRDYQEEAIEAWKNNDYHGFYVMATGTGKTWTAIFSAKKLLETTPVDIYICAPYKHLIKQWYEDLENAFPGSTIILVSSENPKWTHQLREAYIRKSYSPNLQIIVVSTIASFNTSRFQNIVSDNTTEKLLIVDEAHRFTDRPNEIKTVYKFMLGLSATPFSGKSASKGNELMSFFGGQVFNLPIEEALRRKFLVPYNYYPIFVHATDEDEQAFRYHSGRIASCFKGDVCIDPDTLVKALRGRLRAISMATEKQSKIDQILNKVSEKNHLVVYCGDGKLFDEDTGKELRHIQSIKKVLSAHGYKASQFTAKESMEERMKLVDIFNKGEIDALSAIRCLDEGINIPSIKSALILSSNDDYREFVQRRGRILRQCDGKDCANIYDVIVLPSKDLDAWAKIEFRRFYEYAKLAINNSELNSLLASLLEEYCIAFEDIDVYDYEDMEDSINE